MSYTLSDEQFLASRYAVINLVHERNIAGREIPPEVLNLYQTMKVLTASGHNSVRFTCDTPQLEAADDLIGTATTAALLGWNERKVRRHAFELGGIRPTGRDLVFSRRSVVSYSQRDKKELSA